jgi:ABC-type nickel/cobalt efflux system permease component RcnA
MCSGLWNYLGLNRLFSAPPGAARGQVPAGNGAGGTQAAWALLSFTSVLFLGVVAGCVWWFRRRRQLPGRDQGAKEGADCCASALVALRKAAGPSAVTQPFQQLEQGDSDAEAGQRAAPHSHSHSHGQSRHPTQQAHGHGHASRDRRRKVLQKKFVLRK